MLARCSLNFVLAVSSAATTSAAIEGVPAATSCSVSAAFWVELSTSKNASYCGTDLRCSLYSSRTERREFTMLPKDTIADILRHPASRQLRHRSFSKLL